MDQSGWLASQPREKVQQRIDMFAGRGRGACGGIDNVVDAA
jgi:hypothetical protein